MMLRVVEVQRKSPVLGHPSLPCLRRHHTINLTVGCPNRCRYCYAQSMAHHPGWGRLLFYANSLELLRRELPRKRRAPELVFFSTCSDPFVPVPRVLDCLYEVVLMLLDVGSFVLISTKCAVPQRFVSLFARRHPERVHVQVGITSADDGVRALLEPCAPSVAERLRTLEALAVAGVSVEARMDPLTPGLTDAEPAFSALCAQLAGRGIRRAVASHLFLRPAVERTMRGLSFGAWQFDTMERDLYTFTTSSFCAGSTIRLPSAEYRRAKLGELREVAAAHGIALALCSCTNGEVTSELCHPAPRPRQRTAQALLFA